VWATLRAIDEHLVHGNLDIAEQKLDEVARADTHPEENRRANELRSRLGELRRQLEIDSSNRLGDKYFDVKLERYEKKWLAGTPSAPKIRLFLERCREFRERWPEHPRLDWVDRNEARFRGHVDLSTPRTWDDVTWELNYLVDQPTRNYALAVRLVDAFLDHADGEELVAAKERRDELVSERAAYFEELMTEARRAFDEKDDVAQAVWHLVHGTIWIGDPNLADRAASTLVKIPDLADHLRGYAREHPDRLELLLENARVRAYADANGLTP
jgi:hypothetical protein